MRITAIALAIALSAGTASAQGYGGHIGLYSDSPGYSDCNLTEAIYVTNSIYVVHTVVAQAYTAQFAVIHNWDNTIVGSVSYEGNLAVGDIYEGVTVTYIGCQPLPHLLAVLRFIPLSPTPECTFLVVVPDPAVASGQIEVVDCDSNVLYATGGYACINMPLCCVIGGGIPDYCELPVATEATTWGQVKALYR